MKCLFSFTTKDKLKSLGSVCKNHDYCHMVMLEEDKNVLKYNQDQKYFKTPFINYADTESLLVKIMHVITIQKNLSQPK